MGSEQKNITLMDVLENCHTNNGISIEYLGDSQGCIIIERHPTLGRLSVPWGYNAPYETFSQAVEYLISLAGGATTDEGEVNRKADVCRGAGTCGNCETGE